MYLLYDKENFCKNYTLNSYRYGLLDVTGEKNEQRIQEVYEQELQSCRKSYFKIRLKKYIRM